MMEKGDSENYRGKKLDDINVDGLVVSDESEGEYSDISCSDENQELPENKVTQIQEQRIVKPTKLKKQKQITTTEKPVVLQKRTPKIGKKSKFIRVPWTEEQKAITKKYF